MNTGPTFSDEQLTAYLDGETEHVPADEIRSALESDSELRARLDALSMDTGQIAAAFEQLLEQAPPAPEMPDVRPPAVATRRTSLRWLAAAAVAGVAVGWGGGLLTAPPSGGLQGWRQFVAAYHSLYTSDTLANIDRSGPEMTAELQLVADAIEKPIDLQILSDIGQLDYKRAQVLGFKGRPLAQLTFLSDAGAPVALCIIRARDKADKGVHMAELRGMSAASWVRDGYDYLLIGGKDADLIKTVADDLVRQL